MEVTDRARGPRFSGKSVLISGGAGGMGLSAAQLFAEEGAKVSILDLDQAAGEKAVAEITAAGGEAHFRQTDVSKSDAVEAAVAEALARQGRIDVLYNHAGTIIVKPLHESSEADYERMMDINLRSAFLVCRAVVRAMRESGGGSIVATASIGSEKAFALESLYCMSKAAVLMLARVIAVEYRDAGIRCNAVCPGFVKTAHGLREIDELDGLGQSWEEGNLAGSQGRICEPEEVARAVLFLASDEASFINGSALYVDNGWFVKG
ncbi:MAG: SDR family oxidoreductase [Pseudomonadota bacterium]